MTRHDPDVPDGPRIRVRLLLALLRIVAGRRGNASVVWTGAGFTYTLGVVRNRTPGSAIPVLDIAPDADPDIVERVREVLYPEP